MHPRAIRERLLITFWWLVFLGVVLTAPLFGMKLFQPQHWVSSGVINILIVAAWGLICWLISKRFAVFGVLLFILGLMPFIVYSTAPGVGSINALNLTPSSRIALLGPLELMLGVLGGVPAAVAGLALAVVSFWGAADFAQLLVTGHQLVLYAVFGTLVKGLLRALEERQDRLEAINARLEQVALTDAATGLLNRHALETNFRNFQKRAKLESVAVAMWDVDGLKRVNDSAGHGAGDKLLRRFTDALRVSSSPEDALYRVGGDEFISIHPGTEHLGMLIDRTRNGFPEVSVGWVLLRDHTLDALLLEVDALMYADKQTRRKSVVS
jgi:diguanylate cyclase (GGDEF)-like protein